MTHTCPGPECTADIPYEMLACRSHWYQVPRRQRNEVYAAWDHGLGARTQRHYEAMQAAIMHMRPLRGQR
jgi:hypothetical protein